MTKDLTQLRYFIYLQDPAHALYTTFGEYWHKYNGTWKRDAGRLVIRKDIDQEVPDTCCHLFGIPLAVDKT